ncbi:MAG: ATP-dependent helicase [Actinomycetota bacterium]
MLGNSSTVGALLVVGPAGSGKTTFLRERYVELARAGERGILPLVHSRRAARALSEQILRELGTSTDQVRVTTWHSYGLSLLRSHYRRLGYRREPGLLTGPEQFTLVREMLDDPDEQAHWSAFPKQTKLAGFVQELREFVLRAQDALRSPEQLVEAARLARRPDLEEASRFFRRYLTTLDARDDAVVDHANVIARAWQLVTEHPDVADEVHEDTKHILVDDYQDVTPAQHDLLRALFVSGGSVAATANPDARIYGFRGSLPDAAERFVAAFQPVRTIELGSVHRGTPSVQAWQFDHLTEEADAVARECRRLRAREGIPWAEIAIVVRRYGAAARAIRGALERADVPFVVVGENRPLANEPVLIPLLELARAALRPAEREERLPKLLASPVCELDPYEVRALRREAHIRGLTLTAAVETPPSEIPGHIVERLRHLRALMDEVADRNLRARPDDVFWFMWEELDYLRRAVATEDQDSLDAVAAFAQAIERFSDRRPGKHFDDYLDVLEGVEFGPEPWHMPEERRPDAVRLLTAHNAAGSEYEAVIVAGCVEGEFPDPRDRRAMLDIRDLLAPATPFERQVARLAEERRLFGVATSRARRSLLLTCARESSQREALTPSPFVQHVGLDWGRAPSRPEPLTRHEAEATARRTLRDATIPETERLDALTLLARLPDVDPDAWWYERDWTDPGAPLVPEDLRTSYSRLSNYDNCALQYLYSVELGLDPDTSHAMLVGTWVHDIVDRCARGEIGATEDALLAALEELWDPTVFESVAIEHRRKIDSQEMLRRWLAKDGSLETLASEVAFEFPIDGALMRGRIDRVVRLGKSMVRLIDYKTGRNAKREKEAAEDLQLASYYLALTLVPELSTLGTPKYLELAYLGAFTRDGGFMRAGVDPSKDPEFGRKAQERLEGFVAGIRAERFAPSPSADCRWCRFKTLCPVWPEGDEVAL